MQERYFLIQRNIFDKEIYNIVSSNNTVKNIIDNIKKIKKIKIKFVKTRIMNQLSYEISSSKIKKHGFIFKDSLKKGIFNTLNQLRNIKNN